MHELISILVIAIIMGIMLVYSLWGDRRIRKNDQAYYEELLNICEKFAEWDKQHLQNKKKEKGVRDDFSRSMECNSNSILDT